MQNEILHRVDTIYYSHPNSDSWTLNTIHRDTFILATVRYSTCEINNWIFYQLMHHVEMVLNHVKVINWFYSKQWWCCWRCFSETSIYNYTQIYCMYFSIYITDAVLILQSFNWKWKMNIIHVTRQTSTSVWLLQVLWEILIFDL